jgi:hypothetical protein
LSIFPILVNLCRHYQYLVNLITIQLAFKRRFITTRRTRRVLKEVKDERKMKVGIADQAMVCPAGQVNSDQRQRPHPQPRASMAAPSAARPRPPVPALVQLQHPRP